MMLVRVPKMVRSLDSHSKFHVEDGEKGRKRLTINGFRFGLNKNYPSHAYWRCIMYGQLGCTATAKTVPRLNPKKVFIMNHEHNHGVNTVNLHQG